tara:strand:+ start:16 stop:141 length:126 start_codon:yes stop_codon:yes gene_type:complete
MNNLISEYEELVQQLKAERNEAVYAQKNAIDELKKKNKMEI